MKIKVKTLREILKDLPDDYVLVNNVDNGHISVMDSDNIKVGYINVVFHTYFNNKEAYDLDVNIYGREIIHRYHTNLFLVEDAWHCKECLARKIKGMEQKDIPKYKLPDLPPELVECVVCHFKF